MKHRSELVEAASSREPLLLRGAVRHWPAASWTVASLAARVGDAVVPVHTGRWKPAGWRVARDGATVPMRGPSAGSGAGTDIGRPTG